jgi:hypothetical protein
MLDAVETKAETPGEIEGLMNTFAEAEPSRFTAAFFRELCQTHSETATIHACLRHIGRKEATPAERQIADWLIQSDSYMRMLITPDSLPVPEAMRAAAICRRQDTQFLSRLQRFLTDKQTPARLVLHGICLLGVFDESSMLVPLLRTLTHHESERIRSQAAKTLCKLRPNRMLIERQLHSHDPRTRANAVEALWEVKTMDAAEILRMAASDIHHRVAVNALVGLYYHGDQSAFDRLLEFARHQSPLHRLAAVWAFGHLGDPRGIPALEALLEDPRVFVRKKTAEVLARLQSQAAEAQATAEAASTATTEESPAPAQ